MATRKPNLFARQLKALGVPRSQAYMISYGQRQPSLQWAIRIYKHTGQPLGPLTKMTEEQVRALVEATQDEAA
jgi:hypothetical protein